MLGVAGPTVDNTRRRFRGRECERFTELPTDLVQQHLHQRARPTTLSTVVPERGGELDAAYFRYMSSSRREAHWRYLALTSYQLLLRAIKELGGQAHLVR